MSYAAMCLFALAAAGANPADEQTPQERTPHELRQAVHAALRASAPTAQPDAGAAVPQLVELFDEVAAHPEMIAADRTRYQGLLKARLKSLAKQLTKDLPEDNEDKPAARLPDDKAAGILAQQAGNRLAPGLNNFNPNANANAAGNRDVTSANAEQLIDLIERTIAPTTWERAGGLGTIRYYRPLRVLVIRQTGDVHEQLGGLIGNLKK
jgi:hypothetical protein